MACTDRICHTVTFGLRACASGIISRALDLFPWRNLINLLKSIRLVRLSYSRSSETEPIPLREHKTGQLRARRLRLNYAFVRRKVRFHRSLRRAIIGSVISCGFSTSRIKPRLWPSSSFMNAFFPLYIKSDTIVVYLVIRGLCVEHII